MPRRSKLTDEQRIAAVQEYLEGKGSYAAIAKRYILHKIQFSEDGFHAIIVVKTLKSAHARKEELP